MHRSVSVQLDVEVTQPALLVLQVAVATPHAQDELSVTVDGAPLGFRELLGPHGGRLHVIDAPVGSMAISYTAEVCGRIEPELVDEVDLLLYRRPSRYCPADRFLATAAAEFAPVTDVGEYVQSVTAWVHDRLLYIGGSSRPTDDAVDTLLLGEGVCRDYAHMVISLLRAQDIPARLAAVYAPGLDPMDFHAVTEAWVEGAWRVVDATGLAPRQSLLRIATGRDTADTAFMSTHDGKAELTGVSIVTVVDELPYDDPSYVVALS